MTTKDLASELPDVSQPSLYRHIGLLIDAKLIRVVEEQPVRGSMLRHLEVNTATDMRLDLKTLPVEVRIEYFARYLLLMLQVYSTTLREGRVPIETTPMPFLGVPINLEDAQLRELFGKVLEYIQANQDQMPGDDRMRYLVSFMAIPDPVLP